MPLAYTIKRAVEEGPLSRSALYLAMKNGTLRYKQHGCHRLILADDLRRFLESLPTGECR
jgi:hypothetical protein